MQNKNESVMNRRKWMQSSLALTAGGITAGGLSAAGLTGAGLTAGLTAGLVSGPVAAQTNNGVAPSPAESKNAASASSETSSYGAANLGLGVTKQLGEFLAGIQYSDLSPAAIHEAKRAVLDWLGCALAGSQHPTPQILISTFNELGSFPAATVLGQRSLKLSLLDASVANGQMGHVLDFDDTHLGGVILHTSTATLPALLALGEKNQSSGKNLIVALVAAFEAGIRTGQAMPRHHHGGWHLTGTLGTVAATAGSAKLLGLDAKKTIYALGIGCTQAAGMQQNRGSDCKSLHAGKSAYHGVLAASLAANGFNSSQEILDGNLGFVRIYSSTQNLPALTADLGKSWLITGNGYKPYACGVVLHPLIDAAIKAAALSNIAASDVASLEMTVHPDVIRITGVDTPGSGLMSKFSANHAAAVAYIDQAGGVLQFSNERAQDASVQAMRKIVQIKSSTELRLDQASAKVTTKSGKVFEASIAHATGTVANPMSDKDLENKFIGNVTKALGAEQARKVIEMIWSLDQVQDVGKLVALCS